MDRRNRSDAVGFLLVAVVALSGAPALAASHLWRINELFTNADGSVQFIELKECCGGTAEHGLLGKSTTAQTNGSVFNFPANLTGNTAGRHLLLATTAFAALPGAPTPDYIIGANFFSKNGDTIRYAPAQSYDTFTFGAGIMPTDGIHCLQMTNFTTHTFVTSGVNTPTNYAGQTGSVVAGCVDTDGDGYGTPGDASCPNGSATDCNNNNNAIHPGATELCNDDVDNDCNGLTDCQEPACAAVVPCVPTVSEFGVLVMALLVLTGGSVVMLRRRAARVG